jgi:hypothetical protein
MVNLAGEIFRKLPQFPFRDHPSEALSDSRDTWHFASYAVRLPRGRRCGLCFPG